MAGTDDYGQGVSIAALTDAPDAGILAKNIANAITSRSIMRFTSASNRTASLTGVSAPVEGMVSWLQDTNRLYVYDGSAWNPVTPVQQSGTVALSFTNQDDYSGTSVTFPVAFTASPRVFCNINNAGAATARWQSRAITISTTGFTPFVFASTGGANATWSSVEIQWLALSP